MVKLLAYHRSPLESHKPRYGHFKEQHRFWPSVILCVDFSTASFLIERKIPFTTNQCHKGYKV